jgi:anti-anti-sigma factor
VRGHGCGCRNKFGLSSRGVVELESDSNPVVLRMSGEHDRSTVGRISAVLAGVIATAEVDVVVDFSEVSFVDASTLGCLADVGDLLQARHRSLKVRSVSPFQRRLLEICELGHLIETSVAHVRMANALESWVEIPVMPRLPLPSTPVEQGQECDCAGQRRHS